MEINDIPSEVMSSLGTYLILLVILVAGAWYLIALFFASHIKKPYWFVSNAIILFSYTGYLVYKRLFDSGYGGALVWEFYMILVPLAHTLVLFILTSIINRLLVKR